MKYSRATEVWFRLNLESGAVASSASAGTVLLAIEDNGHGFHLSEVSTFGNGLLGMKKRMEAIGGACVITSAPSQGTRIQLSIPIQMDS